MSMVIIKKYLSNYKFVCASLKAGKAAVIETDTVVGIISKNKDLIYEIKQRPLKKK